MSNESEENLASEHWQYMRVRVTERSGGECELCGAPQEAVHHLTYERQGHELMEDLLAVCDDCHKEEHRKHPLLFPAAGKNAEKNRQRVLDILKDRRPYGITTDAVTAICEGQSGTERPLVNSIAPIMTLFKQHGITRVEGNEQTRNNRMGRLHFLTEDFEAKCAALSHKRKESHADNDRPGVQKAYPTPDAGRAQAA